MQTTDAGKPICQKTSGSDSSYPHSHNSVIERSDLDRTINFLVKVLVQLDARKVAEISAF